MCTNKEYRYDIQLLVLSQNRSGHLVGTTNMDWGERGGGKVCLLTLVMRKQVDLLYIVNQEYMFLGYFILVWEAGGHAIKNLDWLYIVFGHWSDSQQATRYYNFDVIKNSITETSDR